MRGQGKLRREKSPQVSAVVEDTGWDGLVIDLTAGGLFRADGSRPRKSGGGRAPWAD